MKWLKRQSSAQNAVMKTYFRVMSASDVGVALRYSLKLDLYWKR